MIGPFRGVVVDGHTIGRPCCKVHNCTHPLITNRRHFCRMHNSTESKKCAVTDCEAHVQDGFRTCNDAAHRQLEDHHKSRGQAFFQLQQRLKRAFIGQVTDSLASQTRIDDDDDMEDTPKSDQGNYKPKARFGRRRTHNEQLIVCCCGVIAARATMFGAEAISGVKVCSISLSPADSI